jgi:hypothetical protein
MRFKFEFGQNTMASLGFYCDYCLTVLGVNYAFIIHLKCL